MHPLTCDHRSGYSIPCALRRWCAAIGLSASALAVCGVAGAGQPLTVPQNQPVFSAPMATIDGHGTESFHITLGMLVTRDGTPVGLYRSYPSKSATPLAEEYGLGMLGTQAGVILASYAGIPLLVLHGHIAAHAGDYPLTVAYLTRLTPRRYAACTVNVARSARGQWQMVDGAGQVVTRFVVVSGPFGVHSIEPCGKP